MLLPAPAASSCSPPPPDQILFAGFPVTVCLPSLARRAKTGLELGEQGQGEPLEADSRKRDPTVGAQKKGETDGGMDGERVLQAE